MRAAGGNRLHRVTALAAIAAMLAFAQVCAFHAGLCGAGVPAAAVSHHASGDADHAQADHGATHDDDCCEHPGSPDAPRTQTCCSTWSTGEERFELRAPSMIADAFAVPMIASDLLAPETRGIAPQVARNRAGPSPPVFSILRI